MALLDDINKLNEEVLTISSELNAISEKKQDQNVNIERLITQIDKIVEVSLNIDIDILYSEYLKVKEDPQNKEDKLIDEISSIDSIDSIEKIFEALIETFFSAMHTLTTNYELFASSAENRLIERKPYINAMEFFLFSGKKTSSTEFDLEMRCHLFKENPTTYAEYIATLRTYKNLPPDRSKVIGEWVNTASEDPPLVAPVLEASAPGDPPLVAPVLEASAFGDPPQTNILPPIQCEALDKQHKEISDLFNELKEHAFNPLSVADKQLSDEDKIENLIIQSEKIIYFIEKIIILDDVYNNFMFVYFPRTEKKERKNCSAKNAEIETTIAEYQKHLLSQIERMKEFLSNKEAIRSLAMKMDKELTLFKKTTLLLSNLDLTDEENELFLANKNKALQNGDELPILLPRLKSNLTKIEKYVQRNEIKTKAVLSSTLTQPATTHSNAIPPVQWNKKTAVLTAGICAGAGAIMGIGLMGILSHTVAIAAGTGALAGVTAGPAGIVVGAVVGLVIGLLLAMAVVAVTSTPCFFPRPKKLLEPASPKTFASGAPSSDHKMIC